MSTYRTGKVVSVERWDEGISCVLLDVEGATAVPAIVLERLVGSVAPGDEVVANTTAVDLDLGSGGYHFVLWRSGAGSLDTGTNGHIMKLRYTPLQFNFEAVEERLTEVEVDWDSGPLGGMPVVAGSVHSQLLPVVAGYMKERPGGRLAYVMTEGGALPAAFSDTIRFLKKKGWIGAVITCGNAFGGDLEALTLHGALVAAKVLDRADAAVAVMGPGIAGTGTPIGFTGMEQGEIVNAAGLLGGQPIVAPRVTFADDRERHRGLSHHTVNALRFGACFPSVIALPAMTAEKERFVRGQLAARRLDSRNEVVTVDASGALEELDACGFPPSVMGRGTDREPEFFMAAAAAGILAARRGR